MSRNGRPATAPSRTIRIAPPCSATNRRPVPSPAFAIASGAESPLAAGSRLTATRAGSKRPGPAADADGRPLAPGPPEAPADVPDDGIGEAGRAVVDGNAVGPPTPVPGLTRG